MIVALPSTLTGSIGVFGGKFVVRRPAGADRADHRRGRAGRALVDVLGPPRFTDDERARLAATIDAIYDDFVAKVAQGRGRPVDRDRRHRPRPGVDRQRRAGASVWSTSSAVCATRSGSPARGPGCPTTRRSRRPLHVPPLARLGRPKNSEDPRALTRTAIPGMSDLAAAWGLPAAAVLSMPPITIR